MTDEKRKLIYSGDVIANGFINFITEDNAQKIKSLLVVSAELAEMAPIAITAFGDIILCDHDDYIISVDLVDDSRSIICQDKDIFEKIILEPEFLNDYFDMEKYEKVQNAIGKLQKDECYTYEPLPIFGGDKSIDTMSIGKYLEYFEILIGALSKH